MVCLHLAHEKWPIFWLSKMGITLHYIHSKLIKKIDMTQHEQRLGVPDLWANG